MPEKWHGQSVERFTMRSRAALTFMAAALTLAGSLPAASAATMTGAHAGTALLRSGPDLAVPAAGISRVTLGVHQSGDNWILTVEHNLRFSTFEKQNNFPFVHWVELWEQDDSSPDDHIATSKHNVGTVVDAAGNWSTPFKQSGDSLDTELGGEEIYAKVILRNQETGQQFEATTPRAQISP